MSLFVVGVLVLVVRDVLVVVVGFLVVVGVGVLVVVVVGALLLFVVVVLVVVVVVVVVVVGVLAVVVGVLVVVVVGVLVVVVFVLTVVVVVTRHTISASSVGITLIVCLFPLLICQVRHCMAVPERLVYSQCWYFTCIRACIPCFLLSYSLISVCHTLLLFGCRKCLCQPHD